MIEFDLEKFKKVNVNVFEKLQKYYEEHFNRRLNKLGCSEVPFGAKKIIIGRLLNIPIENSMKMLHGKIHHAVIQQKKVRDSILKDICEQLDINFDDLEIINEKIVSYEVTKGKILEGHIDIYTNMFLVEIKTSAVSLDFWKKKMDEISPYHVYQLNTYEGLEGIPYGYVLHINLEGFKSKSSNLALMDKRYKHLHPVIFNKKLHEQILNKAKIIFKYMGEKRFDLPCPEFDWECDKCPNEIKKVCKSGKKFLSEI